MQESTGSRTLQHRTARPYRALPLAFVRRTVELRRPLSAQLNMLPFIGTLLVVTLFLLPQFQASGELLCTCNFPPLPQATHTEDLERGPIVTISLDRVTLNGDPKADTRTLDQAQSEGLIQQLHDDLVVQKNNFRLLVPDEQAFKGLVNIQADKRITYRVLRRVLATCAAAGYDKPQFVVETAPEFWRLPGPSTKRR